MRMVRPPTPAYHLSQENAGGEEGAAAISGGIAEQVARAQEMDRPAEGDHAHAEDRLPGPAGEKEDEHHSDAGHEDHRAPGMERRFDERPGPAAAAQDE